MTSTEVIAAQVYSDGRPYRGAVGRNAPKAVVVDLLDRQRSVVRGTPSPLEFMRQIKRELKIRFYQPSTIRRATWGHTLKREQHIEVETSEFMRTQLFGLEDS